MKEIEKVNLVNTKLIAHRGLSGIAPENTLEAFIKAGETGYFGIECDIHVTKDKQFVVFHDFTLERMTGVKKFIKDLTVEEIKQLTIISGNNIDKFENVKIPTIEEYLKVCIKYNCIPIIEIKEVNDFKDLDHLMIILNNHQLLTKAIIISFQLNYLIYLRQKYENVTIQFLVDKITEDTIDICKNYSFDVDTNNKTITKDQIDTCHKNNILVNTYTVDNKKIAEKLSGYGIDFITTNRLVIQN